MVYSVIVTFVQLGAILHMFIQVLSSLKHKLMLISSNIIAVLYQTYTKIHCALLSSSIIAESFIIDSSSFNSVLQFALAVL